MLGAPITRVNARNERTVNIIDTSARLLAKRDSQRSRTRWDRRPDTRAATVWASDWTLAPARQEFRAASSTLPELPATALPALGALQRARLIGGNADYSDVATTFGYAPYLDLVAFSALVIPVVGAQGSVDPAGAHDQNDAQQGQDDVASSPTLCANANLDVPSASQYRTIVSQAGDSTVVERPQPLLARDYTSQRPRSALSRTPPCACLTRARVSMILVAGAATTPAFTGSIWNRAASTRDWV